VGVATGTFQFPNSSPVANGLWQWKLNTDAIQSSTANCIVPPLIKGNLDSSGNMTATFVFNDDLLTSGGANTTYQLTVKDVHGGQVWNESYYLTGTAANINAYPPAGSGIGLSPLSGFVLTHPPGNQTISSGNLSLVGNLSVANLTAFNTTINALAMNGNLTEYDGFPVAGLPIEIYSNPQQGVSGSFVGTASATGSGSYRISWGADINTRAATNSTLGPLLVSYYNFAGALVTVTAAAFTNAGALATSTTANAATTALLGSSFSIIVNDNDSAPFQDIVFNFNYASTPASAMLYDLLLVVEAY